MHTVHQKCSMWFHEVQKNYYAMTSFLATGLLYARGAVRILLQTQVGL